MCSSLCFQSIYVDSPQNSPKIKTENVAKIVMLIRKTRTDPKLMNYCTVSVYYIVTVYIIIIKLYI